MPCHWILLFYEKSVQAQRQTAGSFLDHRAAGLAETAAFFLSDMGAVLFAMKKMKRRRGFVFIGCFMLLAVLHNPVKGFELDVLDVGQEMDLSSHERGDKFLFDGSTDVSKVGTYRMLPFLKAKGVKK